MKAFLAACGLVTLCAAIHAAPAAGSASIEHGEFLVGYGGCNDCHTPGWGDHGGQAPKDTLLTGSGLNFQGPWGTSYPTNLRLYFQGLTLDQWMHQARALDARPPMPGWVFRYLGDQDLADIYAYVRSLGPAGQPAHEWVPPGRDAPAPYLRLVLPAQSAGH